jgi:DNA polymerase-1
MGVLALKQNLSSTREEAQNFYNAYFETFSGLAKYLEDVKSQAVKNGYTETFFGRRRYFEGIRSKIPYVRAQAERMAINAPIQGTEADVVKIAMVKIDEFIAKNYDRNSVRAILQVHDELVYEIKEDLVDTVTKDMTRIMESVIDPKDSSGVVLKVSHKSGDDWGGLK